MRGLTRIFAAAFLLVAGMSVAFAEAPPKSGIAVFDEAVALVQEHFYQPSALPGFDAAVADEVAKAPTDDDQRAAWVPGALRHALAALGASHTGYYTPDQLDYYELADIFRFNYRRNLRRMFPPDGRITYSGIGIASTVIDGARFVTDVYDGGPADKAGVKVGDEILALDGAPFTEVDGFRGKVGKSVSLSLRRTAGGAPMTITVPVEALEPSDALIGGITNSATVTTRGGRTVGYLHIWTFAGGDVEDTIGAALRGPLKDADALVVDLRGRWGGAPPDAAEIFLGGTPPFTFIDRDGTRHPGNPRWHKPIVAIIDGGTRSGLEVFAYALKLKDVSLIGERTAGNLLGGRAYMLSDGTLLEIAVAGVEVNGQVLEGKGVAPDMAVPFDLRYAAGADPQRDAATDKAFEILGAGAGSAG